jgi:hypothetical protein
VAPSVTLTTSASSVQSGQSATLSWVSNGVTSCTASGDWSGTKSVSGSESTGALSGSLTSITKTYTLTCTGPGGSPSATATVQAGAGLSVSPTSLSFGNQRTGTTSAAQTVTVTNISTATLNVPTITLAGVNPSEYTQSHACTSAISPNGTCTINVSFKPTQTGNRTAEVKVEFSSPQSNTRAADRFSDVAMGVDGSIYVVEFGKNYVHKISAGGEISIFARALALSR